MVLKHFRRQPIKAKRGIIWSFKKICFHKDLVTDFFYFSNIWKMKCWTGVRIFLSWQFASSVHPSWKPATLSYLISIPQQYCNPENNFFVYLRNWKSNLNILDRLNNSCLALKHDFLNVILVSGDLCHSSGFLFWKPKQIWAVSIKGRVGV